MLFFCAKIIKLFNYNHLNNMLFFYKIICYKIIDFSPVKCNNMSNYASVNFY